MMKKTLFAAMLALASTSVLATDVCSAPATSGSAPTAVAAASSPLFIQVGFTPKCSANVYLSYSEVATSVAVASASKKGKNSFKGNSTGGGVVVSAACASTAACAASDVTTALTAAEAMASSSGG